VAAATERPVEEHLRTQCARHGALIVKLKPYLCGLPDRGIWWYGGVHDLVETKRPKGGHFEPLQLRWHDKLRQRGHNVFVIYTREEVNAYIESRKRYWGKTN
jgi:hypothetical protein